MINKKDIIVGRSHLRTIKGGLLPSKFARQMSKITSRLVSLGNFGSLERSMKNKIIIRK